MMEQGLIDEVKEIEAAGLKEAVKKSTGYDFLKFQINN